MAATPLIQTSLLLSSYAVIACARSLTSLVITGSKKWLEWLGDSVAWDITEEQIDGLLEALSNAGMATSTVDVARNGRTYAARVSAANALSTGPMASLL